MGFFQPRALTAASFKRTAFLSLPNSREKFLPWARSILKTSRKFSSM